MICGVGIDMVEIDRIKSLYKEYGQRFLQRVFTDHEITYCTSKHNTSQHLSGRFAAKEAVAKALGTGMLTGIAFKDIEVVKHLGPPCITLHNRAEAMMKKLNISKIHLSISHDAGLAIAFVILESAR
ncbi:MAG TPA: holo-ACP synthase [Deltaproteobacteria bacterium]|nr:holo-ACP synthase [Deltaproteobacteria bacterium]